MLVSHPLFSFIRHARPTLLIGARGSFKTALAHAIGAAVANGLPFAGIPTGQRGVIFHGDSLDDLDAAYSVVHERTSRLAEPSDYFGSTCDSDMRFNPEEIKRVALETPRNCLVILDDIERMVGIDSCRNLTKAVGSFFCNLPSDVSVLATMTATPDELDSQWRSVARQFEAVLEVERYCGQHWVLRLLHSKHGPELFEVDGEVLFAETSVDELGNETRFPVAMPFMVPHFNQRVA